MIRFLALICLLTMFLGGCATMINGPTQIVPISSSPLNATVVVDGKQNYITPCQVTLARGKDHTFLFHKAGYHDSSFTVKHVLSGTVAGNILVGGLIGWGVDAATGSQYKLVPPSVHVALSPVQDGGRR